MRREELKVLMKCYDFISKLTIKLLLSSYLCVSDLQAGVSLH